MAKVPVSGHPDPSNSPMIIDAVRQAILWSQLGVASGLVTNPSEILLHQAGFTISRTEYLLALHPLLDH